MRTSMHGLMSSPGSIEGECRLKLRALLHGLMSSKKGLQLGKGTVEDAQLSLAREGEIARCPPFRTAKRVHRNGIQQKMPPFLYGTTSSQKLYTTEDAHLSVRPNDFTETVHNRRRPPFCTAQRVHRNGIQQEDVHLSACPNEFTETVYNRRNPPFRTAQRVHRNGIQ